MTLYAKLRSTDPVGYAGTDFPVLSPTEEWSRPPISLHVDGSPLAEVDDGLDEVTEMLSDAIFDPYLTADALVYRESARVRYSARYSHALADPRAIEIIRDLSPILEVGAGTGWWARLIQTAGGDVIASDSAPGKLPGYAESLPWTLIHRMDAADAALEFPDRAMLMVWPPRNDVMAARALRAFGGSTLIYVGEGHGGACADDVFFNELSSGWSEVDHHRIPTWDGLSDSLSVYKRN